MAAIVVTVTVLLVLRKEGPTHEAPVQDRAPQFNPETGYGS
jgi:hypothetical protein